MRPYPQIFVTTNTVFTDEKRYEIPQNWIEHMIKDKLGLDDSVIFEWPKQLYSTEIYAIAKTTKTKTALTGTRIPEVSP